MAGKTAVGEVALEYTPTWVVAVVCSIIVIISLALERSLHFLGKVLKKKKQNALYEALLKVKEGSIHAICVPPDYMNHMQPCKNVATTVDHSTNFKGVLGGYRRRLLATEKSVSDVCVRKGKVPVLSLDAIHKLHIFIFVLAITHVLFSVTTMLLGLVRIREWNTWEQSIRGSVSQNDSLKVTDVRNDEFIDNHFFEFGKGSCMITWLYCFGKQFFGSIRKSDYKALRLGFIKTHCPRNQTYDFYKYMIRNLEADFKKVVGLSWYLWIFVIIFLLLNIDGWHTYFWISFLPIILLLAVGAKLEHVIVKLAHGVAEKHAAVLGPLVIKPEDDHFWFRRPRFVLYLIHFILFQNAFDIAFFFWILTSFGFKSCTMGPVAFVIVRLVLGVVIQILCSYSTLPLYAIVTQMRTSSMEEMFDENTQGRLREWAQTAKNRGTKETPITAERVTGGSPDVLLRNMVGTGEINNEEGPNKSSV